MKFLSWLIDNMTSAYSKKDEYNAAHSHQLETVIGRIFSLVDWGFGIIEDSAERIRLWDDLDQAEGVALDRHGDNWGVARGGASDRFYRLLIKTKILAQLSGGDIGTIVSAIAALYEIDPVYVGLENVYPAKIRVSINHDHLPEGYEEIMDLVGALTIRLLAAGVGFEVYYLEEDSTRGDLHIGGAVVSEFTRIRLAPDGDEMPDLDGIAYIGGAVVAEMTRIRLQTDLGEEG